MAKKKANNNKAKALSKSEILNQLAERTKLSKKEVGTVIDELTNLIGEELSNKKGARVFNLPGLLKLYVQHKPATKAAERKNPFTGQMQMYPAKPAKDVVKARPLKALKDQVQ
jgi:nucleoid DNA-binding protein